MTTHYHTLGIEPSASAEEIKAAKIPIRQIVRLDRNGKIDASYYIVYTKHANRIAEVLKNDPNLQRLD